MNENWRFVSLCGLIRPFSLTYVSPLKTCEHMSEWKRETSKAADFLVSVQKGKTCWPVEGQAAWWFHQIAVTLHGQKTLKIQIFRKSGLLALLVGATFCFFVVLPPWWPAPTPMPWLVLAQLVNVGNRPGPAIGASFLRVAYQDKKRNWIFLIPAAGWSWSKNILLIAWGWQRLTAIPPPSGLASLFSVWICELLGSMDSVWGLHGW